MVVSWERILVLDGEVEEDVKPSLALSDTGSYDSIPQSHGLSTCFQNRTTCLFMAVPYKAVGSALGDIVM